MTIYGLRSFAALVLRGWLRLFHRLEIEGLEHLPKEGSFVMVANHSSHLDALCLLAALPLQKLHSRFSGGGQRLFFCKRSPAGDGRGGGQCPALCAADPHSPKHGNLPAIARQSRNILILFPEGTRTGTGQIR